jgi:hypothetical protein
MRECRLRSAKSLLSALTGTTFARFGFAAAKVRRKNDKMQMIADIFS